MIPPSSVPSAGGFLKGLAEGVYAGAKSMATGLYDLAAMSADGYRQLGQLGNELYDSPQAREEAMQAVKQAAGDLKSGARQAGDFAMHAAENPRQTIASAKDGALAAANAARAKGKELIGEARGAYADALAKGQGSEFIGKAVGRTGFEIAALLVGTGEASIGGKLGEAGDLSKMGKLDTVVLPCGKAISRAEFEAGEAAAAAKGAGAVGELGSLGSKLSKLSPQAAREALLAMPEGERLAVLRELVSDPNLLNVATERGTAVFYSGRVKLGDEYISARKLAEREWQTGKTTLENTPGGKFLDQLDVYQGILPDSQADEIWTTLSRRYADGASGPVTVFMGDMREGAVLPHELELLAKKKAAGVVDDININHLDDLLERMWK